MESPAARNAEEFSGCVIPLPVCMSHEDLKNRPGFATLLSVLEKHITSVGGSKHLDVEAKKAEELLVQHKAAWFRSHVLLHELHEAINDHDISQSTTKMTDTASLEFYESLKETLLSAEANDCQSLYCEGKVMLLGLTPDVNPPAPTRMTKKSFQERVSSMVDQRLRQKCARLQSFRRPSSQQWHLLAGEGGKDENKLLTAACAQLSAVIAQEKAEMEEAEVSVRILRRKQDQHARRLCTDLMHAVCVLEETISKYALERQSEYNQITVDWLVAKCNALCLKLRLLELQVLGETYTSEAIGALKKVRSHLDKQTASKELELLKSQDKLRALESVGMGFDELVTEYVELCNKADSNRWALAELKQSLAGSGKQLAKRT